MNSTSTEEVSIHAVFAASSFGGSAAAAPGAQSERRGEQQRRVRANTEPCILVIDFLPWMRCTLVQRFAPSSGIAPIMSIATGLVKSGRAPDFRSVRLRTAPHLFAVRAFSATLALKRAASMTKRSCVPSVILSTPSCAETVK